MSNKIQVIQDKSGDNVFPITHEKAVRDSSGVSLEAKLSALNGLMTTVIEDGFYIIDSDRNIGFMVNTSGAHSANLVEY